MYKKVCVQYRNPSAHKQKDTKISVREYLDYMIDVKKLWEKCWMTVVCVVHLIT